METTNTPAPAYRIVAAPRFAAMMTFDCGLCGHHELGKPVFVAAAGGSPVAYGTGCAATLVYGRKDARTATKVRNAADAATHAAKIARKEAAEYVGWYTAALAEFTADPAGPWSDVRMGCTKNYHAHKNAGRLAEGTTVRQFFAGEIARYTAIAEG